MSWMPLESPPSRLRKEGLAQRAARAGCLISFALAGRPSLGGQGALRSLAPSGAPGGGGKLPTRHCQGGSQGPLCQTSYPSPPVLLSGPRGV